MANYVVVELRLAADCALYQGVDGVFGPFPNEAEALEFAYRENNKTQIGNIYSFSVKRIDDPYVSI